MTERYQVVQGSLVGVVGKVQSRETSAAGDEVLVLEMSDGSTVKVPASNCVPHTPQQEMARTEDFPRELGS